MRYRKWTVSLLLCLVSLATILPMRAEATGLIDAEAPLSLTVTFRSGDTALADLPFSLYQVADMDVYGELTVTEAFSAFRIDIRGENDEAWRNLAATLEGYVAQSDIMPVDVGVTDETGCVTFPSPSVVLPRGLYFVPGFRYLQDGYLYEAESFLVLLPCVDEVSGEWIYDLDVQPKYSQPEDLPMVRKVIKVWDDEGSEEKRPAQVVVQLLRDGEVYDTVTLSAENDWRCTWVDLSGHYRWTVVEQVPQGYTVEITQEGIAFIVKNTYKGTTPSTPNLPQTGQLWWPVPVLAAAGLFCLVLGLLRRRGERP